MIDELNKAVDYNIEYRTGIHKNPITESLSRLMDTIDRKLGDIDTDAIMEFAQVFSGMTGELTPEKMLDAYTSSDIFKQNYKQMIADRENRIVEK